MAESPLPPDEAARPAAPDPGWEPPAAVPLRPLPWEDRELHPSWWDRFTATVKLSFKAPQEAAERIPAGEGLWPAYTFLLLCSAPALILSMLGQVVGLAFQGAVLGGLGAARPNPFQELGLGALGAGAMALLILGLLVVVVPAFLFLGLVVGGALNHASLWMFGGTKAGVGLGQTIRCYGYANGAYQLVGALASIPLLGCLFLALVLPFAVVWMVFYGLALARMHRTEAWRGVCAVFAPAVLACCCAGLALAAVFGVIASHAH